MMRAEDASREALAAKIAEAKRHFVSEVQHAVDPRRRAWVMDRFRKY
jgi:type IV pilus biogenesis protein CpaD/CtpE